MLSPSEFNNAVPKFTNGNYANNPIDPTYIEEPTLQDYNRGVEPLETLPAQWWNWLCNQFTSRFNKINTYVKNIFDEITQLLSLLNVLPDGTESAITTGQLKNFFKELYPSYVSDKLSLGTTYVPQTRTVNGHALSGDITVTKSDVGLGSVANTGDSANVSNGGTTKFTTGGAYNILTSIASIFSSSTAYSVGALVTYQNKFYECTTAHSAGAWNSSHFTARSVSYIITNYILPSFAPTFSTGTDYSVGAFVIYQNKLYKCTTAHSAGAWNSSHFTLSNLGSSKANKVISATDNDIALLDSNGDLKDSGKTLNSFAEIFSISGTANNTQYVTIDLGSATTLKDFFEVIDRHGNYYQISVYLYSSNYKCNITRNQIFSSTIEIITGFRYYRENNKTYLVIKGGSWFDCILINNKNTVISIGTVTNSDTDWNKGTDIDIVDFVKTDNTAYKADKADLTDLASTFSTSTSYTVGEYVIYNEDMYRCTVAHSASAWNSSHFTLVTVGSELENKADISDLAVPTDAVLHYSFDEVPDYPDGTAVMRKTSFSSTDGWSVNNGTISVENNGLKFVSDGTRVQIPITNTDFTYSNIHGNLIKIKIKANFQPDSIMAQAQTSPFPNYYFTLLSNKNGEYTYICNVPSNMPDASVFLFIVAPTASSENYFILEEIYIGDGSYSTPIIDNANGQNNATNSGGIAVQGVSGKGVLFSKNSQIQTPYNNLSNINTWSLSFWVNINRGTNSSPRLYRFGNAEYCFVDNFNTTGNIFNFLTYQDSGHSVQIGINMSAYYGNFIHLVVTTEISQDNRITKNIYINGKRVGFGSGTITQMPTFTNGYIGTSGANNQSMENSIFDDFQIFSRTITESEVTALYLNKANTPKFYNLNNYKIDNANVEEVGGTGKYVESIKQENGLIIPVEQTIDTVPTVNSQRPLASDTLLKFFGNNNSANTWLGKVFGWALGRKWAPCEGLDTPEEEDYYRRIAYGNNLWLASGYGMGLWSSTDGKSWTKIQTMGDYEYTPVYGNRWIVKLEENLFWSDDGITWTPCTFSQGLSFGRLKYINGLWLVGTDDGTWWSEDGKQWTKCSASNFNYSSNFTYNPNATYPWVASTSSNNGVWHSTDGKTWLQSSLINNIRINTICAFNTSYIIGATNNSIWVLEGETAGRFPLGSSSTESVYDIKYKNGIIVAIASSGYWWSINGISWKKGVLNGTELLPSSHALLRYASGLWLSIDYSNSWLLYSLDGVNWLKILNSSIFDVIYGDGLWLRVDINSSLMWSDFTLLSD